MNKNELISAVAESSGLTRGDATKAVEGVFDAISGALKGGDEVRLVGFGTFSVARRRPRTIRNTRTGQAATVGGRIPRFKPSAELKRAVR